MEWLNKHKPAKVNADAEEKLFKGEDMGAKANVSEKFSVLVRLNGHWNEELNRACEEGGLKRASFMRVAMINEIKRRED